MLMLRPIVLSVYLIIFNPCCSVVLPTDLPGGFVRSPIVFSSLFMMRSENFSSVGTLEVSIFSLKSVSPHKVR